jgi:DNA-directed RNA polymerase II subunit RPB1
MSENPRDIKSIHFGILSPEDIRKYSVLEIVSADLQYEGHDGQGGLNDAHLGVVNKGEICKTCHLDSERCPGHFGHINLAVPLFKQEYTRVIKLILDSTCIKCGNLLIKKDKVKAATLGLVGKDAHDRIKAMLPSSSTKIKICGHCYVVQPKIQSKNMLSIEYTYSHTNNSDITKNNENAQLPDGIPDKVFSEYQPYPTVDIHKRIKALPNELIKIFGLDQKTSRPEWMMWTVLPVSPPVVRPNTTNDGQHSYDDWTHNYIEIITLNSKVRAYIENGKDPRIAIKDLNIAVAAITFNTIDTVNHRQTRKPLVSIKARLDGKDGLFRKNLTAKRVNFGGRSVVSAGPHTPIHHLGIPKKIAMILTVPIKATKYNIDELQQAIINGPNVYPGANYISSGGNIRNLRIGNRNDIVVNIGDEVGLHIREGDPVLFNRQPTLWRPSILCHAAEIVPHFTFRLNLSACTPYNADFDGDEMNIHVPQSEATMAESKFLASVHKHLISSQTSSIMCGIDQDSLTGIALFTHANVKFNRILAAELALWGDKFDAIDLGSKKIWNSRDIISLILPRINVSTFSKIKDNDHYKKEDKELIIRDGQHVSGIIDSAAVGTGSHGTIPQIVWRDYGPKEAAALITRIQEIAAHYLIHRGFSISLGDMMTSKESVIVAKKVIRKGFEELEELLRKIDSGQFVTPVDVTVETWFEQLAFIILGSPLTEKAGKSTYAELNTPDNPFVSMIDIGSKGTLTDLYVVTACLGQLGIVGKRAQATFGRRTLPFYHRSEQDPVSKGYSYHSQLDGMNVMEVFFMSQSGREGVTATAINTASAGYLARRMTKMSERIRVEYNYMARGGDEIIQLIYPFDAWYMENQKIEHIRLPMKTIEKIYKWSDETKKHKMEYSLILEDIAFVGDLYKYTRINDKFALPFNMRRIVLNGLTYEKANDKKKMTISDIDYIIDEVSKLCTSLPLNFMNPGIKIDEIPKRFVEVSRMSAVLIRSALASKRVITEYNLSKATLKYIINEVQRQFSVAIIAPKEMVGYISAQSISEIGTQATIDTFHNVGTGKNGKKERYQTFSRLLEILNNRKDIKFPLMFIPLSSEYKTKKSEVIRLKNKIEYISLRSFLKKIEIIYDPDITKPQVYDKEMVERYFKYTPKEKSRIPADISPFMIRFTFNRQKIYHKQIDLLTFKLRLESFSSMCYAIVSDINDDELIMRVHVNVAEIPDYNSEYELKHVEKIMEYIVHDLYVRGVKGLANINIIENVVEYRNETGDIAETTEYHLEADGNNISGVAGLVDDAIDKTRIETNDIYTIYKKYGIEAARKSMCREIFEILKASKSNMSYMHVRLLVDNMTYGGFIMPLNRHGFKRRNPGPLIRMAFEQNTLQITKAAMNSEKDELKYSPTGSIIFGQNLPCGTGAMMDIHMDESRIGIQEADLNSIF